MPSPSPRAGPPRPRPRFRRDARSSRCRPARRRVVDPHRAERHLHRLVEAKHHALGRPGEPGRRGSAATPRARRARWPPRVARARRGRPATTAASRACASHQASSGLAPGSAAACGGRSRPAPAPAMTAAASEMAAATGNPPSSFPSQVRLPSIGRRPPGHRHRQLPVEDPHAPRLVLRTCSGCVLRHPVDAVVVPVVAAVLGDALPARSGLRVGAARHLAPGRSDPRSGSAAGERRFTCTVPSGRKRRYGSSR